MKRLLIALLLFIALIVGALFFAAKYYEEPVRKIIIEQAEANTNARLRLEDFSLSFLTDFPRIGLDLKGIGLKPATFQTENEWVSVASIHLSADPFAYLKNDQIRITNLEVEGMKAYLWTDNQGNLSIDQLLKASEDTMATNETSSPIELAMESYNIEVDEFFYADSTSMLEVRLQNLSHIGSLTYSGEQVGLDTKTSISALSYATGDTEWISDAQASLNLAADYVLNTGSLSITQADLIWNRIPLNLSGSANTNEPYELNIQFEAPSSRVEDLIAALPASIQKSLTGYQAQGSYDLKMRVDGLLDIEQENYPALNLELKLSDGALNAQPPIESIQQINVDLILEKQQGSLNTLQMQLNTMKATVGNGFLEANARITNPIGDVRVNGAVKTDLDLSDFKSLGGDSLQALSGRLKMDLKLNYIGETEKNFRWDDRMLRGNLMLTNAAVVHKASPIPVEQLDLSMDFSPQELMLKQFFLNSPAGHIQAQGLLTNFLGYALSDEELNGSLSMQSDMLNLDVLSEAFADTTESELTVIPMPDRIDFKAKANLDEVVYGGSSYRNLSGDVALKDQKLSYNLAKGKFLDGALSVSGTYSALRPEQADATIKFSIVEASLGPVTEALAIVSKYVPMLANADGKLNLSLDLASTLGSNLTPIWTSVFANGQLEALNAQINAPLAGNLANMFKQSDFTRISAPKFLAKFSIQKGQLNMQPANFSWGSQQASVQGGIGVNGALAIKGSTAAPVSALSSNLASTLGLASAQQGVLDLPFSLTGTLTDPKLNIQTDALKTQATQLLQNKLDAEKMRLKREAQARAEAILADAEAQAARLKAELDKEILQLENSSDQQINTLMDQAGSNPIKKAAARVASDKIRKESQKKIDALKNSMQNRIDSLLKQAEDRAQAELDKVDG